MRTIGSWVLFVGIVALAACGGSKGADETSATDDGTGGALGTGGTTAVDAGGGAPDAAPAATGGGAGTDAAADAGPAPCDIPFYDGETFTASGAWADPSVAGGASTIAETTTNPHGGTTAMQASLLWNATDYGSAFGWSLPNNETIDATGMKTMSFWIRTDTGNKTATVVWLIDVTPKPGKKTPLTPSPLTTIGPQWQNVRLPMSTLANGLDVTQIAAFSGDTHAEPWAQKGGITFVIDDVCFLK
jgi:hypothetical protein